MSNSFLSSTATPVLALVGPTAIGKTALSLELAHRLDCEIVSVDSMQVYRYMDIGTAKIPREEMAGIPHHLIDIITPDQEYDAAQFVRDANQAIVDIAGRGKTPLLTGGTGLYLKALVSGLSPDIPENSDLRKQLLQRLEKEGIEKLHEELCRFDPASASRIHGNDKARIIRGLEIFFATGKPWSAHIEDHRSLPKAPPFSILQICLSRDRAILYERINRRTLAMVEQGLEGEVRTLLGMGYGRNLKTMNSIGYRHMLDYLDSRLGFEEMVALLQRDTRRYAKRQFTWFRGIRGMEWYEVDEVPAIVRRMSNWLQTSKLAHSSQ